jgi:hypothetical protein
MPCIFYHVERENVLCLEGGLVSPKRERKRARAVFWRIFYFKKSAPANSKKAFYTTRLLEK